MSAVRRRAWGRTVAASLVVALCVGGWQGWQRADAQAAIESLWSLCGLP